MKRMIAVAVAAGAGLVLCTTAASAQSFTFGAAGGLTIPTGDFKTGAKTGWHAIGHIGYAMPSGLGFRGEAFYGQNALKGATSEKFKLSGGLGSISYEFQTSGSVKPYVIGSAGVFNGKALGFSETKFTFGGGGGVKLKAGSDGQVFLESRYLSIQTSGGSTNFIPITLGFSFGG